MKVGILNHWMVNNYGAVCLAYGLEKKLIDMGYDVETIQWLPDEVRYPWSLKQLKRTGFRHYVLRLGYFIVFVLPRQKSFASFRTRFHISEEEYRDNTISKIADKYDKIIVGGDQLWNYKENYLCIENYLPFVKEKKKKVCYAASLSQDEMREDFAVQFKKLVEDFWYVTTREIRAREIIESICSIKAPRVTDSAFLISRDEWYEMAVIPRGRDYIFVYQVQSDKEVIEFANNLAREKNCEIVYCPFPLKKQIKCQRMPYISIEQWLGFIAKAKWVVTDAFHGIVFSIIFNTDFYCEISEYGKDTGSRITNVLEIYGLKDRLINGKKYEEATNIKEIDWGDINSKIKSECKEAELHLAKMLET